MESTSVPATHCQATYTNNIPAPSYQPRRLRVPPAPLSSGKAPTLHYLHRWQHKFLFWRWWWPIPRIWNRLLLLTHILPMAVAVGKVAAAWARGVRRCRGDEQAEDRVLLDHGLDRVIFGLQHDLQTVLLV